MSNNNQQEPQTDESGAVEGEVLSAAEDEAVQGDAPVEDVAVLLEDARAKADEHWNETLKLRAEMDNLRKRTARELENAHKYALEKFSNELLSVVDSLEMGVAAAANEGATVETLREGSEMTLKQLLSAMEKHGIAEINPEGERFDPDNHQAMTMQETDEVEPNMVVAVFQKGYTLNDRLIRPARVVVSKAAAE
ncbi:nucleotide exchange factor GrpE [Solemya pervernicosa gill symbiont]|uniref:Protein GrpE n=2 Tax=Gammaproteobacteria incertae sedis TaxID=118884 RepID=A0A1T2L9K1_9GAMM|nr:nucleotide exchange factor GrpE [Candidatus Reidiella endopervernicosa]OOZ41750.1 nucleotide exchange factor GrpE [Solemya pervernicosa gill symbiont]QKQ26462.1 nucleotide exchange factor GrpE [Candidatus Reidiella endopervernicosa]